MSHSFKLNRKKVRVQWRFLIMSRAMIMAAIISGISHVGVIRGVIWIVWVAMFDCNGVVTCVVMV